MQKKLFCLLLSSFREMYHDICLKENSYSDKIVLGEANVSRRIIIIRLIFLMDAKNFLFPALDS